MRSILSLFSFLGFFFVTIAGFSQATIINGIVNDYTCVTNVDCSINTMTVANSSAFSVGDRVVVYQAKGAEFHQMDAPNFGDIINYHSAGKYEFAAISAISGNDITFQFQLINDYQVSGAVQLVRVPQYTNAAVSGVLTAAPFDGCTGGILAVEVAGRFDILSGSSVNLDGVGFRGFYQLQNNSSGCGSDFPDYVYSSAAGGRGAPKGEGIGGFIAGSDGGRGKQVSGGGGGNDHNAGGGGGGNYGSGGNGGQRLPYTTWWCGGNGISSGTYPGVGGIGLDPVITNAENRIFMGSGGGAGHDNNATGFPGGTGGGIAIIRANEFRARNKLFLVRGESPTTSAADAGSGGGGGGTILLDVNTYIDLFRLFVGGGDGGDHSPSNSNNCMGPGGGGGGGLIWIKQNTFPSGNIGLIDTTGGDAGISISGTCGNTTQGAGAGNVGRMMYNLVIPESATGPNNCGLAVDFANFSGYQIGDKVRLDWATATESNSSRFRIQRSVDGKVFDALSDIDAVGNSSTRQEYTTYDTDPHYGHSYYRLQEIDRNGRSMFSPIVEVYFDPDEVFIQSVYPNPVGGNQKLNVTLSMQEDGDAEILVFDLVGKEVYRSRETLQFGKNELVLPSNRWDSGIYFLKLSDGRRSQVKRIVVNH